MSSTPNNSIGAAQGLSLSSSLAIGLSCFFAWTITTLCIGPSTTLQAFTFSNALLTPVLLFLVGASLASILCVFTMKYLSHPLLPLQIAGTLLVLCCSCSLVVPSTLLSAEVHGVFWLLGGIGEAIWFFMWMLSLRRISLNQCRDSICGSLAIGGALLFLFSLMYADLVAICLIILPVVWLVAFVFSSRSASSKDPFDSPRFNKKADQESLSTRFRQVFSDIKREGLSKVLLKGLHSLMFAYLFGLALAITLAVIDPILAGIALGCMIALASLLTNALLKKDSLSASTIITNAFIPVSCVCFFGIALAFPTYATIIFGALIAALSAMLWIMSIMSSFNYLSFAPIRYIFESWCAKACSSVGTLLGWLVGALVMTLGKGDGPLVTLVVFGSLAFVVILDDIFFKKMRLVMSKTVVDEEEQVVVQETATILPYSPKSDKWLEACDMLAEAHGLSPRQKEVFLLLANGRNTEYISKILGLSTPTVKTHTYAVYQKLGIHSHQALIDLIERTAFNG